MSNWEELKEFIKNHHARASKLDNPAGRLLAHVYKEVKDKMWSIEKKNAKQT